MSQIPEYRIRLFLSVDLVGSTNFKSKNSQSEWIKAFSFFYSRFNEILISNYQNESRKICPPNIVGTSPKVWKTIGDEIIFCCKAESIQHISMCVMAFTKTLNDFHNELIKTYSSLGVKGNSWLADFPAINCSLPLISNPSLDTVTDEEREKKADETPNEFDFLGKSIDTGFRISRNSNLNFMTICPHLAYMLAKSIDSKATTNISGIELRFNGVQSFKGVVNDGNFPVLGISTYKDEKIKRTDELESKLQGRKWNLTSQEIIEYLDAFFDSNNYDKMILDYFGRGSNFEENPPYKQFKEEWQPARQQISKEDSDQGESEIPIGGKEISDIDAENESRAIVNTIGEIEDEFNGE